MGQWGRILTKAAVSWVTDNAFMHAAAVSFYTLFSLVPVTIIALAVTGFVFGKKAAEGELADQMTHLVGRESAGLIQKAVLASETPKTGWSPTALGVVLLLFGATTVFAQTQESLNILWGVTAKPDRNSLVILVVHRLLSFAMVLTVGFLLLVSLIVSTVLTALVNLAGLHSEIPQGALRGIDFTAGLVVIAGLFAFLFKFLPDVRLTWGDVWLGALVTSILFSIGRLIVAWYLDHSTVASIYGTAGSLAALLVWVYYSCAIMFFGVELTRCRRLELHLPVVPKSDAVRIRRELVGDDAPPRAPAGKVRKQA